MRKRKLGRAAASPAKASGTSAEVRGGSCGSSGRAARRAWRRGCRSGCGVEGGWGALVEVSGRVCVSPPPSDLPACIPSTSACIVASDACSMLTASCSVCTSSLSAVVS